MIPVMTQQEVGRLQAAGKTVPMYRLSRTDLINALAATPTVHTPDPYDGKPRLRTAAAVLSRLGRKP